MPSSYNAWYSIWVCNSFHYPPLYEQYSATNRHNKPFENVLFSVIHQYEIVYHLAIGMEQRAQHTHTHTSKNETKKLQSHFTKQHMAAHRTLTRIYGKLAQRVDSSIRKNNMRKKRLKEGICYIVWFLLAIEYQATIKEQQVKKQHQTNAHQTD